MLQSMIVVASVMVFLWAGCQPATSQASKKLDERTKGLDQGQQKSWQQVDEINKETDKTKTRYQQAQKNTTQSSQKSGYSVKKTTAGTGGTYRKIPPVKHKPVPPKKK